MKKRNALSRRDAIKSFTILGTGMLFAPGMSAKTIRGLNQATNSLGILSIGVNRRGLADALGACKFGKMVACCDVDTATFGPFQKKLRTYQNSEPVYYTDYRAALERKDVDIVTIGTPDHWHAMIIIDALKAGKDVYVEKPMTLTIQEGIAVCEAVRKSNRVVQVGTQQRSEYYGAFLKAVAVAKEGLLGEKLKATVYLPIGNRYTSEVFPITTPPDSINWGKWTGPVQVLPYSQQRCHSSWRSWVETGHGGITDWGAHHIDIAQWALGVDHTGPTQIKGEGNFPLGREKTLAVILGEKPTSSLPNSYSAVRNYKAELNFENGNTIVINGQEPPPKYAKQPNGILFEGEKGDLWVSRGGKDFQFEGSIAKELNTNKALEQKLQEKILALYKGKVPAWMDAEMLDDIIPTAHMKNFVDCVKDRSEPISDVYTHHRANSSAILAHSSMILGRTLNWDPKNQRFINDDQANKLLSREYRQPYILNV